MPSPALWIVASWQNTLFEDLELAFFAAIAFTLVGLFLTAMILYTRALCIRSDLCQIHINDKPELTKTSPGGLTLLAALTENGVPIPSPCGGKATCKQCRVQILQGAPQALETDRGTFSKKELQKGWRLSCQTKVKEDMHIHIEESLLGVRRIQARVLSNHNVATFIKELVVQIPEEIPYRSGGYLQFHVPAFKTNTDLWKETMDPKYHGDWERFGMFSKEIDFSFLQEGQIIRAYSMASYPEEKTKLMFNIRIATPPFDQRQGCISSKIPWGICSSYAFSLQSGDTVELSGPYGESFMINDTRELVFLIGGAGSSFGRSHVMHLFHSEKTQRKVTFWYGARSLKENIYQKEYEDLQQRYENFRYHLVLSEPTQEDLEAGWPKDDPLKTAFLFQAFEKGQLQSMEDPEECLFYVCGPPMHNKSVMRLLDDYGVPRENIVLDDFGS